MYPENSCVSAKEQVSVAVEIYTRMETLTKKSMALADRIHGKLSPIMRSSNPQPVCGENEKLCRDESALWQIEDAISRTEI